MGRERRAEWRLLRTKTDETVDDPDWAGLNDMPTEPVGGAAIVVGSPDMMGEGNPMNTIMVVVLGTTAARVPVDRAGGTVDLQIVEVIPRDISVLGGTPGDAVLVVDSASVPMVPINRPVLFELNGARQWTVRITNDAALAGTVTQLEVWYRECSL